MDKVSRLQRWFGTLAPAEEAAGSRDARGVDASLVEARQALLDAVAPCTEPHRLRARWQIAQASSAMDLWSLRADLFDYLAQDVGEMQAAQRIAGASPCFNGLVPAVAAHRQSADNRRHGTGIR